MTPLASVLRRKMSAYPASETTPSWMRAPPESFSPTMGAPTRMAMSISLTILAALDSESDPPKTVKSCAKTKTVRPSTFAIAGHEAVARNALLGHSEVGAAVGYKFIGFLKGAFVEQQRRCAHAPTTCLPCAAVRAAPGRRLLPPAGRDAPVRPLRDFPSCRIIDGPALRQSAHEANGLELEEYGRPKRTGFRRSCKDDNNFIRKR